MNEVQGNQAVSQPSNNLQFNSATTQPKSAHPIDPFAEQNAKAAEKKKQDSKKRKIIFIILGVILVLATIGAIIWLIVILTSQKPEEPTLPVVPVTIENGSLEEVNAIQNQAQQVYDLNPNISLTNPSTEDAKVVDQLFTEIKNSPGGKQYPNQVLLAELMFYIQNGYYDQGKNLINEISPEVLPQDQQLSYYIYGGILYSQQGDSTKAAEYNYQASLIRSELGGFGG